MKNNNNDLSQRQAAVVAGVALLLMIIPPVLALSVQQRVFVPTDAAATTANILANEMQFRLAILSFLFVIVLDVIVAWGLYVFFKPLHRSFSLLAAWFRLLYTAVFAVAILDLANALRIVLSANLLPGAEMGTLQTQAWLALQSFNDAWDFALVIFGLHLIVIGYLVLRASYMPKILGILVVICGLGYLFDSVTALLLPNFGVTVSMITFVGEVLLALWLVIKGVSSKQWQKLALEPA